MLVGDDIWFKRNVREAIEIKIEEPVRNRDQGCRLPQSMTNYSCHVLHDFGGIQDWSEHEFMKACLEQ